jgi:hypothetical protein
MFPPPLPIRPGTFNVFLKDVGDGGGGRRLAKDIGFLGRGLKERLMVFLTGLVGGLGSRCFGMDSSHLEVLIEFDLAIFVDPVSKWDPLSLGLRFREDGDTRLLEVCIAISFDSLLTLVGKLVTWI